MTSYYPSDLTAGSTVVLSRRGGRSLHVTALTIERDADGNAIAITSPLGTRYTADDYPLAEVRSVAYYGRPVLPGVYALHAPAGWGGTRVCSYVLHEDETISAELADIFSDNVYGSRGQVVWLEGSSDGHMDRVPLAGMLRGDYSAEAAVAILDELLAMGCYVREVTA